MAQNRCYDAVDAAYDQSTFGIFNSGKVAIAEGVIVLLPAADLCFADHDALPQPETGNT